MAYLSQKIKQLEKALKRWQESLEAPYTELNRDAAIQRFEFVFELFWKMVKIYLNEWEKISCYSPKSCFRELGLALGYSEKDVQLFLKMSDDRNLTAYTYSQSTARQIYKRLPRYYGAIRVTLEKIKKEIKD